jgi:hypothetical protein
MFYILIPLVVNYVVDWSGWITRLKKWLFYRMYTKQTAYFDFNLPFDKPSTLAIFLTAIFCFISGVGLLNLIMYSLAEGAMTHIINKLIKTI